MSDIFLSYASLDRPRVAPIVHALEAQKWTVWWDRTIPPGKTFDQVIEAELSRAKCVVVLWSRHAIDSHWVRTEAEEGRERGILVPALIEDVTIPLAFRRLQAARLVDWTGVLDDAEFQGLCRAVYEIVSPSDALSVPSPEPIVQPVVIPEFSGAVPARPLAGQDNWVEIPAGIFFMGAQKRDEKGRNYDPEAFDDESPVHQVKLRRFRIGRFPVTVQEFGAFLGDGGYKARKHWVRGYGEFEEPENWERQKQYPDCPVVGVSWFEAAAYCSWAGGRLPTEAEWERGARGPHGSRYPWGDEPAMDTSRANYNRAVGHPTPAGSYPGGSTAEGLCDMLGNVWEWCADWLGFYQAGGQENPSGSQEGEYKVLRGGSWDDGPLIVRVSDRVRSGPTYRADFIGFRCAGELR